jgi:hypothetical protein
MEHSEPSTYAEASEDPNWQQAMEEEHEALQKSKTWELTDLPSNKKAIGCKWVYKLKLNSNGDIDRYKARLVAKGYAQEYGTDYEETYAPVAKMTTVRLVIGLATQFDWPIFQLDVRNAFLNGDLHEEIYMHQPQGFVQTGAERKVCRLRKSLYGLKQAPRAWNAKIHDYLVQFGFQISDADPSLYILRQTDEITVLVLYVDDLILTGSSSDVIRRVKHQLSSVFDMKDLGPLTYFLGIEIYRSADLVMLTQGKYTRKVLSQFRMSDSKPMSTPMESNVKLTADDSSEAVDATHYRKLIGSLIYLTITRPDISFAVGVLSQYMQKPSDSHLHAAYRVLRYLNGTKDHGIQYLRTQALSLHGYSDADWAGSVDDRRSTTGFVFNLGPGPISWQSKKQPTVALSSTEAEYRASATATCEAVWLKQILSDLGGLSSQPIPIYSDNQSSIQLAKNPVFHARTKHIEVHYHFIREQIQNRSIALSYVSTNDQVADIFTKPLIQQKFLHFKSLLQVVKNPLQIHGNPISHRSDSDHG